MDNKFVLSQSFNDIVFENRNKKYGAYEIRRKYARYTLIAGAAAILFFTCGSMTWAFVQREDTPRVLITQIDLTEIKDYGDPKLPKEEIKQPETEVPVTPPDKGPQSREITSKIDIVEEPILPPSSIELPVKDPGGVTGGTGTVLNIPKGGDCLDCPKVDSTPPIKIRDWTPWPPTCVGLDEHITKNIHYPQICRESGVEGVVYVEFIVDTKGNYRDVKVVRGAHPALNAEALRVMKTMPTWEPAKDENGSLVDFIMRKPIRFSLK